MPTKHMILMLESPIQSWGLFGCFDIRDTNMLPTKSGVTGILCAAIGTEREDEKEIKKISSLKMAAFCIQTGTLYTDYHTVGHGHTDKMHELPNALSFEEGGSARHKAKTYRDYLCDYKYVVVLSGDASIIDICAAALDNPKWSLHLGRRACIPSRPILESVVGTNEEVCDILTSFNVSPESDCEFDSDTGIIVNDVPVNFSTRKFTSRMVSRDIEECSFIR